MICIPLLKRMLSKILSYRKYLNYPLIKIGLFILLFSILYLTSTNKSSFRKAISALVSSSILLTFLTNIDERSPLNDAIKIITIVAIFIDLSLSIHSLVCHDGRSSLYRDLLGIARVRNIVRFK